MGQNCAGPERFFVADAAYAGFCSRVGAAAARLARGGEAPAPLFTARGVRAGAIASRLKCGPPLDDAEVDCGAITMGRRQMGHYQAGLPTARRPLRGRLPRHALDTP